MAKTQVDRKHSLVEQALDASMIEIKKARKEVPKAKKEPKPKKGPKLKKEPNPKKEPKAKSNNRPPLPKLKGDEARKLKKAKMVEAYWQCTCDGKEGSLCFQCTMIPLDCQCQSVLGVAHPICYNRKIEREANMAVASSAKKFKGTRILGSFAENLQQKPKGEKKLDDKPIDAVEYEWVNLNGDVVEVTPNQEGMEECFPRVKPKVPDSFSSECEDKKIMEEDCPDGIEGCEVMHSVKVTKPKAHPKAPINAHPKSTLKQDSDDETPLFPPEYIIFHRAKESATQCYWSHVVDAIVIALVQYCKEACAGCQSNSRKKHKLCDLPVKTVWEENRCEILARVDINVMVGKWASVIYSCCGVCPSKAESMFSLCDPGMMLQGWQANPHPPEKIMGYDMYDEERDYWRSQLNTRMAKIEHPTSYCSFDAGLISSLDIFKERTLKKERNL